MAIVFCTDFGGWGESTLKFLLKIHQYLCKYTTCSVSFVSMGDMARVVSGIMEHLRENSNRYLNSRQILPHLVLAIRPKHALTFHRYILFLKRLLSISEPKLEPWSSRALWNAVGCYGTRFSFCLYTGLYFKRRKKMATRNHVHRMSFIISDTDSTPKSGAA